MTDTLLDPNDTGEIPRLVGETRIRIDTGEATQNLAEYARVMPPMAAIPRRVFDLDDTVIYMPETIGVVGLDDKPYPKPPYPLPPNPKYDLAAAQPVAPWERVVDTGRLTILGSLTAAPDGELRPAAPGPFPVPLPPTPPPAPQPSGYVGRHRRVRWFTPLVEVWATVYARLWGAL